MLAARLISVKSQSWLLLALALVINVSLTVLFVRGVVSSAMYMYVLQPALWAGLAGLAFVIGGGRGDRVRHKQEKATSVGLVMIVWFVLYFMSGIFLTYVHNSLLVDWRSIFYNALAYGLVGLCAEYVRYNTMLFAGRRNAIWFGLIVALVWSLQQANITAAGGINGLEEFIKFFTANLAPAIVASLLLTYMAVSSGLPSMLVYRLGVIASIVLPPIVPKHDWYMVGVSSILLSVVVYLVIDRLSHQYEERYTRHKKRTKFTMDVLLVSVMTGLVLFMTGFFAYKPIAIMSDSMNPIFARGSVVVVQKLVDPLDIGVGDILQYEASGKMITHRVVEIDAAFDGSGDRVFITKGDNSPSKDPPVWASQVVGIVKAQIPYIGYPTVWLKEASL